MPNSRSKKPWNFFFPLGDIPKFQKERAGTLVSYMVTIYLLVKELRGHLSPEIKALKDRVYSNKKESAGPSVPQIHSSTHLLLPLSNNRGSKDGAMVRALASHQCGPGSNFGVDATCGLSLLLVLSFALTCFSPGSPIFLSPHKPTFPNSNSIRNK